MADYGRRLDGTPKGIGFFGELKRPVLLQLFNQVCRLPWRQVNEITKVWLRIGGFFNHEIYAQRVTIIGWRYLNANHITIFLRRIAVKHGLPLARIVNERIFYISSILLSTCRRGFGRVYGRRMSGVVKR